MLADGWKGEGWGEIYGNANIDDSISSNEPVANICILAEPIGFKKVEEAIQQKRLAYCERNERQSWEYGGKKRPF